MMARLSAAFGSVRSYPDDQMFNERIIISFPASSLSLIETARRRLYEDRAVWVTDRSMDLMSSPMPCKSARRSVLPLKGAKCREEHGRNMINS